MVIEDINIQSHHSHRRFTNKHVGKGQGGKEDIV